MAQNGTTKVGLSSALAKDLKDVLTSHLTGLGATVTQVLSSSGINFIVVSPEESDRSFSTAIAAAEIHNIPVVLPDFVYACITAGKLLQLPSNFQPAPMSTIHATSAVPAATPATAEEIGIIFASVDLKNRAEPTCAIATLPKELLHKIRRLSLPKEPYPVFISMDIPRGHLFIYEPLGGLEEETQIEMACEALDRAIGHDGPEWDGTGAEVDTFSSPYEVCVTNVCWRNGCDYWSKWRANVEKVVGDDGEIVGWEFTDYAPS